MVFWPATSSHSHCKSWWFSLLNSSLYAASDLGSDGGGELRQYHNQEVGDLCFGINGELTFH